MLNFKTFKKMEVITIDSQIFQQLLEKISNIEGKVMELKSGKEIRLSEEWLDNQDVMMLLNVSKRTLQTYRDERMIPFSQVGNKIYYKAKDVEKFLEKFYNTVVNF